jgi:DNA-binding transcriptional LysR family regulator
VEPTPAGLVLVNFAKESVRARNEIVKAARAIHKGEVPPLLLGFSCFVPTSVLEEFQRLYESVFPACPVHLAGGDPAQIMDRLRRKTLDCALLPLPVAGDDFAVLQIHSAVAEPQSRDEPQSIADVISQERSEREEALLAGLDRGKEKHGRNRNNQ